MRSIYIAPWRIDVDRRVAEPRLVSDAALARAITRALSAARAPSPATVTLTLTDDAALAELNATHLGKTGPTDVLSFPLLPPEAFPPHAGGPPRDPARRTSFALPPGARPSLGDIVVSVERAVEQAESGRGGQTGDVRWSPADELRLLVTHGTLHVCGWDHAEPAEETAMRALEQRLLIER
ncbi:MAG: rRNA maturation RNase YbeY [Chloroflexota bacterium]